MSISGQKVLDSVHGALERIGGTDPALENTRQLVSDKLQDATQRYSSLQNKVDKKVCQLEYMLYAGYDSPTISHSESSALTAMGGHACLHETQSFVSHRMCKNPQDHEREERRMCH